MSSDSNTTIERYTALALQVATRCVNNCADRAAARQQMLANIAHIRMAIAGSHAFTLQYGGESARLIVLPEYCLTGFPMGDSVPGWRDKAALEIDGPEYEASTLR